MNKCQLIKDITNKIVKGGSADELIPYDIRQLPDDIQIEMLALYIKYGNNNERREACLKALNMLEGVNNESG